MVKSNNEYFKFPTNNSKNKTKEGNIIDRVSLQKKGHEIFINACVSVVVDLTLAHSSALKKVDER